MAARGARAQQTLPIVGFLYTGLRPDAATPRMAAFQEGLAAVGFVEGQNVSLEYHWPAGQDEDQVRALVADLLRRQASVIVGNTPLALAAKSATSKTPIVFVTGADPVKVGLSPVSTVQAATLRA